MCYLLLAALAQVVGEVVVDLGVKDVGVLRIQLQHLPQSPHADVLQVTVGQRLHVCIGLNNLLRRWQVTSNQVPLLYKKEKQQVGTSVFTQSGSTGQRSQTGMCTTGGTRAF